MWLLDTDYDGRSLFPRQVFFPMAGEKDGWARLAKNLKAEIDEELIEAYRGTVSLPFEAGKLQARRREDRGRSRHREFEDHRGGLMAQAGIDHLIINSPYVEPRTYWKFDPATARFEKTEGRRPAGYVVATPGAKSLQDPGIFVPIPLVETIRPRVKAWRAAGYPGVSGTTRRLLEHWHNAEGREDRRFFFCQLEAIETLIWLTEAPAADRVGIDIPSDGGPFKRLCSKMATGSGKTVVMAMLIAWQVLNKVVDPQNARYSKNVFVVAPGPHRQAPPASPVPIRSQQLLRRL